MDSLTGIGVFLATAAVAASGTALLLPILRRKAILDHPNERASHTTPTPRGGGIAVIAAALLGWLAIGAATGTVSPFLIAALGGATALAALSWWDDLGDLSPLVRLGGHAVVVAVALANLGGDVLVFQGLVAEPADRVLTALAWIWFINLFNFMDGIDGISGVETLGIGVGVGALAVIGAAPAGTGLLGMAVAGAAAGFLLQNWHPAKIFLGDVGSVPLGFLLGWLLVVLAAQGLWAPALILPLYYLADATLTLIRRAVRGEKIWRAHREHFYQKAHQAGLSHAAISGRIAVADGALIGCALAAALGYPAAGLAVGAAVVAVLLWRLATARGPSAP